MNKSLLVLILVLTSTIFSVANAACEPVQCGKVDKCYVGGRELGKSKGPSPMVKFAMCTFKGQGQLFIYDTRNSKHISAIKSGKVCAQVCGDEDHPLIKVTMTKKIGPTPSSI